MIIDMAAHRSPCSVPGCTALAYTRASGLCVMHYARMRKHGSTDDPRPDRHGEKKKHPLWLRWSQLKKRQMLIPAWHDDFWAFVEGVSPQPEDAKKLARHDDARPYGPDNFFWMKTPTREENLAYLRKWREDHPDYRRGKHYEERYDLSIPEYNRKLEIQQGRCAICGSEGNEPDNQGREGKRLCVDHDHDTDAVRDLLCGNCNRALGLFDDNPGLVAEALAYLMRHKGPTPLWQYPRVRKKEAG